LSPVPAHVRQFIGDFIDSVAHLEALLLLREARGRAWRPSAVARRLYIDPEAAAAVLRALHARDLVVLADPAAPSYEYGPATPESARLVEELATLHARQLVAVTRLIHSRAESTRDRIADSPSSKEE
jgi:hypothetical protein